MEIKKTYTILYPLSLLSDPFSSVLTLRSSIKGICNIYITASFFLSEAVLRIQSILMQIRNLDPQFENLDRNIKRFLDFPL